MTKFIRLKTTAGNHVLIHTRYIQSVTSDSNGNNCTVYVAGGVETDDLYAVIHTLDEIQAAIDGEIDLVQRKPVRQPKFDDGHFTL
jgi:hypothetical protein